MMFFTPKQHGPISLPRQVLISIFCVLSIRGNGQDHTITNHYWSFSHKRNTQAEDNNNIASDTPSSDVPTGGVSDVVGVPPTTLLDVLHPTGRDGWNEELQCYFNLTLVHELTWSISPLSAKKFVLCPHTVYEMGNYINAQFYGNHHTLSPRQNTEYWCGVDGNVSNNCTLYGGGSHVNLFELTLHREPAFRIKFYGLTFEGATNVGAALSGHGDVEFHDCVWKKHLGSNILIVLTNNPNIRRLSESRDQKEETTMLEVLSNSLRPSFKSFEESMDAENEQRRGLQQQEKRLKVSFLNCVWQGNTIPTGEKAVQYGMILAATPFHDVTFQDCLFVDNQYDDPDVSEEGYAYSQIAGNTLNISNTCLLNNDFAKSGAFIVGDFDNDVVYLENNFASPHDESLKCPFIYDEAHDQCVPGVALPETVEVCSKTKNMNVPTSAPTILKASTNGKEEDTSFSDRDNDPSEGCMSFPNVFLSMALINCFSTLMLSM